MSTTIGAQSGTLQHSQVALHFEKDWVMSTWCRDGQATAGSAICNQLRRDCED